MRFATLALGLIATTVALAGQTPPGTAASEPAPITLRFLERPQESLTAFRAVRHLEATNRRLGKHAWLDAYTELSPDGVFSFRVVAEGGSGYIRKKVLRPILEGERDIVHRGDVARSALEPVNYEFTSEDPADAGLVRLTVKPKRREMTLIDGGVFVSGTDADLVRVEGRLARNPSFWTTRVDVVRRYGRVAGVRVPLGIESVAHVRLVGASEMTMTYCYEMVNGRLVPPGAVPGCAETREAP